MHSKVSFKHLNDVDIVSQSNVVSYEIGVHICLVLDFFQNSRFSTIKTYIFKSKLLPRLAIFGGFDYMVSISMKN